MCIYYYFHVKICVQFELYVSQRIYDVVLLCVWGICTWLIDFFNLVRCREPCTDFEGTKHCRSCSWGWELDVWRGRDIGKGARRETYYNWNHASIETREGPVNIWSEVVYVRIQGRSQVLKYVMFFLSCICNYQFAELVVNKGCYKL